MKCNHCGSEWTTAVENQKDTCPFCGKQIARITTGQPSPVDKFFDEQIRKIQEQQGKDIRWAKLLGCNPGEKPWIIKSSLFVSADKRADKLIARIKSIHDQELLLQIVEETNDGRVRLAVVKNIADQSILEQLAYNKKHDIRLAVIAQIKNTKVLEHMALSDVSPSVRMAALKHITSQPILQVIAENDEDDEICKAALIRIRNQEDVEQIALWAPNWHKRKIALDFVKSPVVLHKIARSDQNDDVRRAADARLKASPELTVAALFETIKDDLRINGINALPTKIMLYYDGIQFFSENSLLKTVRFDSYGFNALPQYDSWWAVDGSAAPKHVNQLELLAEHINQSMNKAYYIKKVKSETVSWPGSDHEMHHYFQKYIEMNVKR